MAGPHSPFPLRYLDKAVGFLVPRSQASFPVPCPRPMFRFFVPPFFVTCSQIYHNIEICWISLSIPLCRKFIIGIVYRPPQGNVKKFCDTLDEHIGLIQENSPVSSELFIMGDCNINYFLKNTHDMREIV